MTHRHDGGVHRYRFPAVTFKKWQLPWVCFFICNWRVLPPAVILHHIRKARGKDL